VENQDYVLARIIAGSLEYQDYFIKSPTRFQKMRAEKVFKKLFNEFSLYNSYNDEELFDFIIFNNLWDEEKEERLNNLVKEIEDLKVSLYELRFQSEKRKIERVKLKQSQELFQNLFHEKNLFNYSTATGAATIGKNRFLIGLSLYYENGKPFFNNEQEFWQNDDDILDNVIEFYQKNQINETDYRFLARSSSWQSIWGCASNLQDLFGAPSVDLTEEQIHLVSWSKLYDNVRAHQECPPKEIINDDDILDGWLISQRRAREYAQDKAAADSLIKNDKIRNSDEIYIPCNTLEDAKKVHKMNSPMAEAIRKRRMKLVAEKGMVQERDMPDVQQKLMLARNQAAIAGMRKN